MRLEWKFLAQKISMAESDADYEFAKATAIIIVGIVATIGKLKMTKS